MWEEYFLQYICQCAECVCGVRFPGLYSKNRKRDTLRHARKCSQTVPSVLQRLARDGCVEQILNLDIPTWMSKQGIQQLQQSQRWAQQRQGAQEVVGVAQGFQHNPDPVQTVQAHTDTAPLQITEGISEYVIGFEEPPQQPAQPAMEAGQGIAYELEPAPEAVYAARDSTDDTQASLVSRSSTASGGRAPRRNTVAGITLGLLAPGYHVTDVRADGNSVDGISVRQFIVKILEWKQAFNVSDVAADQLLKIIGRDVLRFQHAYPQSWHLIHQIVKPDSDLQYQYTMCLCQRGLWAPIPDDSPVQVQVFANPQMYAQELQQEVDETPEEFATRVNLVGEYLICQCGQQRFRTDRRGRYLHSGVRYYYFGIQQQVLKKFSNAAWAQHYGVHTDQMFYFQSAEYARLKKKLVKLGIDPSMCVFIDIAHDGFMPFKATSSRHSWGVWFRIKNVDPSIHFRYFNVCELALWPQASKPRTDGQVDRVDVQFGFQQVIDELKSLSIPGQPLRVWDAHQQSHREVYVILASMMQDAPGRSKVMGGGGVQAYFSCQWCVMQSVPITRSQVTQFMAHKRKVRGQPQSRKRLCTSQSGRFTAMRNIDAQDEEAQQSAEEREEHAPIAEPAGRATRYPAGYVQPVKLTKYALTDRLTGYYPHHVANGVRVGDQCIKLNNKQQKFRMKQARQSSNPDVLQMYGCRGDCDFLQLKYASYNNLFVLPTYHMLLYGVLRTFWRHALNADNGIITRADLKKMQQREQGVITVSDIPERYDGIKRGMGRWQIKHWMYWADIWFVFICMDITFYGTLPTNAQQVQAPAGVSVATSFTELVHQMHAAVVWFVRPQHVVTDLLIRKHHFVLQHFAQAIECTCGPGPQTTTNLHAAVCRLGDQCRARGHSGHEGELWVERCILVMNQVIGDAHTPFPEKTLVKRLLLDDAIVRHLNVQRDHHNDIDSLALTRDQRVAQQAIQQPDNSAVWFIGKAVWPQFQAWHLQYTTLQLVGKLFSHRHVKILTSQQASLLTASHLQFYPRAELQGAFVIHSAQCGKETVAESHWVLVEWSVPHSQAKIPTIALIHAFIVFTETGTAQLGIPQQPYMAIVQLYKCRLLHQYGRSVYQIEDGVYDETCVEGLAGLRAVPVHAIGSKVHRFVDTSQEDLAHPRTCYFSAYECTTMT